MYDNLSYEPDLGTDVAVEEEAHHEKQAGEAHHVRSTGILPPAGQGLPTVQMTTTTTTDHRRNIRHQTAHLQQEGEPTFIQPAPLAPKWSKKITAVKH